MLHPFLALPCDRHILIFGLQLVPMWTAMDLHAIGHGNVLWLVLSAIHILVLTWSTFATVAFYHDVSDVLFVLALVVGVYFYSRSLISSRGDVQDTYVQLTSFALVAWAVGFIIMAISLVFDAVAAPAARFVFSSLFDMFVCALSIFVVRSGTRAVSPRGMPIARSPRPVVD